MVERTKRGDEERKEEDQAIRGEPTDQRTPGDQPDASKQAMNTTRDRGTTPAPDDEGEAQNDDQDDEG